MDYTHVLLPVSVGLEYYDGDEMEYHSSWDWLMPVLEKVANYIEDNIETEKLTMDKTGYNGYLMSYDIKLHYNAVVEFINEYNKNK